MKGPLIKSIFFLSLASTLIIAAQITEKASLLAGAADRARMAVMCLSLIALSQGVPFFHAGEALRSLSHSMLVPLPPVSLLYSHLEPAR